MSSLSPVSHVNEDSLDIEIECAVCDDSFLVKNGVVVPRYWIDNWEDYDFEFVVFCCKTCLLRWVDPEVLLKYHGERKCDYFY